MVVEAEMSEQRLSNTRFSNKRSNQWSVDLNRSTTYAATGDQLLDTPLFKGSRKADSLSVRGNTINQGGNLSLGKGNDALLLQLEQFSGAPGWSINHGDGNDSFELLPLTPGVLASFDNLTIDLGTGDDRLVAGADTILLGSNGAFSSINTGLGDDLVDLRYSSLSNVNLDTGLGLDQLFLIDASNSNLSSGDDADRIEMAAGGLILNSSLSCGAGGDTVILRGSLQNTAIDTGSDNDQVIGTDTEELSDSEINCGDGNDILILAAITNSDIQTGDGHDQLSCSLLGSNRITLNDGDDNLKLNNFSAEDSIINGGTGTDTLQSDIALLLTDSNAKGRASYSETINDSGAYVFTYYGDGDQAVLTLIGFEQLAFANATFDNLL